MEKYVITSDEIAALEGTPKSHYLNPMARRINKSLGDLTGLTGFGIHIIEVNPGDETTELHVHHHEDECVYVLEGEAQAHIGDEIVTLNPGDFVGYRAGGLAHKLINSGSSVLKCIVVGERLAHDVADYPALNKRLYRNPGLSWNLVNIEDISEPNAGKK
ncbi:MAG: cupin domain-containing protein [Proteobacteria bacterium]|nr:cupin domain-containing protein [Pseudomonadota bacterium]